MRGLGLLAAGAILGAAYDARPAAAIALILAANVIAAIGLATALRVPTPPGR